MNRERARAQIPRRKRGTTLRVPGCGMVVSGPHEGTMGNIVEITLPVEEAAATALRDPLKREALGRLVSRWLQDAGDPEALFAAIERLKADAQARGLTDQIVDDELQAYNAEQRH